MKGSVTEAYKFVGDIELVGVDMQGKESVVMKDVRKEFVSNHKRKVAVNGLTVTLYKDQITAFLGHNGAGKSLFSFSLTFVVLTLHFRKNDHNKHANRYDQLLSFFFFCFYFLFISVCFLLFLFY